MNQKFAGSSPAECTKKTPTNRGVLLFLALIVSCVYHLVLLGDVF